MSAGIGTRIRRKLAALKLRLAPIVRPALHTFWQAFVGLIGIWWIASGADLWSQITDVASAKRFTLALLVAAGAAALSAVKGVVKQLVARKNAS